MVIDTSKMTPINNIKPDNDPMGLYAFTKESTKYLSGHSWCLGIKAGFLSIGYEGILAVFYYMIEPISAKVDSNLWVIVGDIPPAYLVVDISPNGACALKNYVIEMRKWVHAAKNKLPLDNIISVNVEPSLEYAEMLENRLEFIEERILTRHKKMLKGMYIKLRNKL